MKRTHSMTVAENVKRKLEDIARKMGAGSVRVGWLADSPLSAYPNGTPVAAAMFWFEYGHQGQFPSPPRPIFRMMIAKESSSWPGKMAALTKATNYDGAKVLALMGEDIGAALQESLIGFSETPLAASTLILRDKFWTNREEITRTDVVAAIHAAAEGEQGATGTQAKPGVWTGQALRAVAYEVNDEGAILVNPEAGV